MGGKEDDAAARRKARAEGLKFYQNKRPCRYGHERPTRFTQSGICVECAPVYYEKNKKRISASAKKSRAKNAEKIRLRLSEKRKTEEYKKTFNAYCRSWRKLNKNRTTIYRKNFRKKNRELTNTLNRNRKSKLKQAVGSFTLDDILRIYKMQRGGCAYCGKKLGSGYEIDHIVALTKGGTNWPKNLQLLCTSTEGNACNQRKNAKDPIEYARSIGRLL